jgi:hypothetical protein
MIRPDRDYDDILSRVLHSTLDPIEPMGDGLAKIQQRIAEPWLKRQVSLLRTETSALGWLILVRCEPFFSWARSSLTAASEASGRWFRPGPARSGAPARASSGRGRHGGARGRSRSADGLGWLGPTMAWLRPALAVAGAVVIVVAGVFTVSQIRLAISTTANSNTTGSNHKPGDQGGPASKRSRGGAPQSHAATGPGQHHGQSPSPRASGQGRTAGSPKPTPSQSSTEPSPSVSPTSGSPTSTPTQTPTQTPTSSVSPTAPADGTSSGP